MSQLLTLAWPIVLARATQSVIGFTDALMCAPLGDRSLAAATTGALNTFWLIVLPMGTVFIVQSFAAQLKGKGDLASARRYAVYGLVLALAAGVVAAALIPFVGRALGLFDFEPRVHDEMTGYIAIRLTSVAGVVATEALGSFYGGLGNTRMQMIAGAIAMVGNIFLNWVFIYGNLGAPAMGVEGAALASAIATWIGLAAIAVPFWRGWGGAPRAVGRMALRAGELWRVIRFGVPNGVNWLLEVAAFIVFINVVMGGLGTVPLAAINVVIQINSISFMPAWGLAASGAILVGQSVGAGKKDEVWPIVRTTMGVTGAWMTAVGLVYLVLPGPIVSWFAKSGPEGASLREIGATMLALSAVWQLFDACAMTLSETLRATGDTAWSMWARVILAWFVFVPIATLLTKQLGGGPVAAMLSLAGYLLLLAIALGFRFWSGAWRGIELIEPELV